MEMEWVNIVVTAAIALLSALGGAGLIFWRQTKRMKEAEAERAEVATQHEYVKEWKELYEKKEAKVNELDAKIDDLRKELRAEQMKNNLLELEKEKLKWAKCTVNGCKNRQPPHYYDTQGNEVAVSCEHCNK